MNDETSEASGTASESTEGKASANAPPERDWDAFTFHQDKLEHLTNVGLFLAGGFITLFQLEVIDLRPIHVPALVMVILSSMISVAFEASLGNEAGNEIDPVDETTDQFGIPKSAHWAEVVVLILLGGAIGYMGSLFLMSMEIV